MKRTAALVFVLIFAMLFSLVSCDETDKKKNSEYVFIVDGVEYARLPAGTPEPPKKDGYVFDGWYLDDGVWNVPLFNYSFVFKPVEGNDSNYVVSGDNKIEFAIKFPAQYWLTQAILITAFGIPNSTYMTNETLTHGKKIYQFFVDGLPIDTHVRRSFTELGISALHNIVSLSGCKPKSSTWINNTLQQKQNQEPDLDSPFAW